MFIKCIIPLLTLLLLCCSGKSNKPDPLHSVQGKQVLKRSVKELPQWVFRPLSLWIEGELIQIKVYSEGQTSLSNAIYQANTEAVEKARLVLHDHLRERWLVSAPALVEADARLTTALFLNSLLATNINIPLSNALQVQDKPYWELWQRQQGSGTIRAFSVYHRFKAKTEDLDALLQNRAKTMQLSNGSPAFQQALTAWLRSGPLTHDPPSPVKETNQ